MLLAMKAFHHLRRVSTQSHDEVDRVWVEGIVRGGLLMLRLIFIRKEKFLWEDQQVMLGLILEYNKMLMSIRSLRENLQFKS